MNFSNAASLRLKIGLESVEYFLKTCVVNWQGKAEWIALQNVVRFCKCKTLYIFILFYAGHYIFINGLPIVNTPVQNLISVAHIQTSECIIFYLSETTHV